MSDYSRVKKYENLRNNIEHDKEEINGIGTTLNQYNQGIKEGKYVPSHEKTFASTPNETINNNEFKNEYLDSFIQEVRDYNMQKGIRENEDTKLDILQQLTAKNREKRANYIEKIEDTPNLTKPIIEEANATATVSNVDETTEISRQIFALLNEDKQDENTNIDTIEKDESVSETQTITQEVSKPTTALEERIAALEQKVDKEDVVVSRQLDEDDDIAAIAKRDLLEETMKLKVQMKEYKEELNEINSDVDSNNRLLNIIIIVLIVALLAVVGVVVYWLISGGLI